MLSTEFERRSVNNLPIVNILADLFSNDAFKPSNDLPGCRSKFAWPNSSLREANELRNSMPLASDDLLSRPCCRPDPVCFTFLCHESDGLAYVASRIYFLFSFEFRLDL
jgi:hypothetical protein